MNQLNAQQLEAVHHLEGPMLVLAGPGSGKTTMITHRILHMIQERGIEERKIWVVTYTRAAAQEMRSRFLHLRGTDQTETAFGTFHSLFWKMLRDQGELRDRSILEEGEQLAAAKQILAHQGDSNETTELAQWLLSRYEFFRNTGQERGERVEAQEIVWRRAYEEYKRERRKMDFDDILAAMKKALEQPNIRRSFQAQYQYFLVDEFQDVNPVQYEALKLLVGEGGNLFVVGDDDQAIYGFRGAAPGIMLRFPEDFPGCRVLSLRWNYRSTSRIVEKSTELIVHNRKRYPKAIEARQKKRGPRVRMQIFEEEKEEYRAIAREAHRSPGLCVLFRTHSQMRPLLQSLEDYGIAYHTREHVYNPYAHWIGDDILEYRRAALGDQTAFLGVLRRYGESIPLACISWLREGENAKKILDYPLGIELRTALTGLFYELDHVRRESPAASLHRIASRLHYFQYLQRVGERRGIDPARLKQRYDFFQRMVSEYKTWEEWEENRRQKIQETMTAKSSDVLLLTMHAAKGLEFDTVWIPGLEEGMLPHERAEDLEEERRLLYVGCTRAKTRLILSRNLRRGGNQQSKSLFWTEIDEKRSDNL